MNEEIKRWLESPEGEQWSRNNHHHHVCFLMQLKDDLGGPDLFLWLS